MLTLVIVWSNALRPLFFSHFTLSATPHPTHLLVSYTGWYWVHLIYRYFLLFTGISLILYSLHGRVSGVYRRQALAVILVAFIFGITEFMSLFQNYTFTRLTLMSFGVFLGVSIIMWAMLKYRFLQLAPLARKALINHMPEGLMVIDTLNTIVDVNPSAGEILGRTADELLGRSYLDIFPGISQQMFPGMDDPVTMEEVTLAINGDTYTFQLQIVLLVEGGNAPVGWLFYIRDMTERYRAQRKLDESKQEVREIYEQMKNGFYRTTPSGEILLANQQLAEMLGYASPAALEGKYIHELSNFEAYNRGDFIAQMNEQGVVKNFEATWTTTSGTELIVHINGQKRYDERTERLFYEGVILDITERIQLQRQLQHAQKMESLGRLAGGVAHDFNNILTSIAMNAEFGIMGCSAMGPTCDQLQEIQTEVDRGARITRQLLAFSRQQQFKHETLDVHGLLSDLHKLFRKLLGEHTKVVFEPAAEIPRISADSTQLEQVFMNLAINAKDTMPKGGTFTLTTSNISITETSNVTHSYNLVPGTYVLIAVRDTGTGIDPAHLDKIFDPFFTTKPEGEGTGLGLSIVHGIIQQHDGDITVESQPGEGTVFHIYLPVQREPSGSETSTQSEQLEGGTETILVLEDESSVRDAIYRVLDLFGYQVLVAETGEEGLRQFQAHSDRIDLVIADVVLPELNGPEFFEQVTRVKDHIPFIFISGYPENNINTTFLNEHDFPFYRKPVSARTLLTGIREVLQTTLDTAYIA